MKARKNFQKSIIIFSILIISFNIISLPTYASGEQTDFLEDFEDDLATFQANDSYYGFEYIQSRQVSGNPRVLAYLPSNGTKSYFVSETESAEFEIYYLGFFGFSFWYGREGAEGNTYCYVYCNDSSGNTIIKLRAVNDGTGKYYWQYYEIGVGWDRIGSHTENGEKSWISVNMISQDTANYTFRSDTNNVTETGSVNYVNMNISESAFRTVYIMNTHTLSARGFAFDDFRFYTNLAISEDETPTIYPCEPLDTIGRLNVGGYYRGTSYKYMWCVYGISRKMYIHSIDLEVDVNMGDLLSNTHVFCKINEVNCGFATSLVQISDDSYRFSWQGLNVLINNTPTTISFKFDQTFGTGNNRAILPITKSDINQDGYNFLVFYNDDGYYNNHGQHIYDTPDNFGTTEKLFYEPVVRMCIDTLANAELNPDLTNTIQCTPDNVSVGEYTKISYTVDAGDYSSNMYINVQKEGQANVSYAKVNTQASYVQYTPLSEGNYYANLSIDGVTMASDTFIVSGSLDDYVYTIPNPSQPNSWFTLYYNYSKADYGSIRIFDAQETLIKFYPIDPTSYGSLQVQLPTGSYMIKLCKIVDTGTGTVYVSIFDYPHSVFSNQIAFIDVLPKVSPTDYPVLIWGQHSHIGQNVVIKWGETEIRNVANEQQFSFYYYSEKEGAFPLQLLLVGADGTQTVLGSVDLSFNNGFYGDVEKDSFRQWLDSVPIFYKILAGLIITIFGFLMPYILMVSLNKQRKIPVQFQISGTLTMSTGLITSCICAYVGLYGWEFTAIAIMLIMLSVFIMYLLGNRNGA